MNSEDILSDIGGDKADPAELEHVLLGQFHQSTQPTNSTVIYGRQGEPAAELTYDTHGRPVKLETKPAFTNLDLQRLRQTIAEQLLAPGERKIGRIVMFTGVPTSGWYRYRDDFQIFPVPPEAPKPPFVMAEHPLILEVAFGGTANSSVDVVRLHKRQREIELVCGLLVAPSVYAQSFNTSFHWVYEPAIDGAMTSAFRQGGYHWPGMLGQTTEFSSVEGLEPLGEIDHQSYYSRRGAAVQREGLTIPTNFTQSLDIVRELDANERKRFIRACYWYQQSAKTRPMSSSIALEALICAIEALMPPTPKSESCPECNRSRGPGPTKLFIEFVDRFAPGISKKDREQFYGLRSAITHGDKLLHADEVNWSVGLQSSNEWQQMHWLDNIVRTTLLNWLHAPAPG